MRSGMIFVFLASLVSGLWAQKDVYLEYSADGKYYVFPAKKAIDSLILDDSFTAGRDMSSYMSQDVLRDLYLGKGRVFLTRISISVFTPESWLLFGREEEISYFAVRDGSRIYLDQVERVLDANAVPKERFWFILFVALNTLVGFIHRFRPIRFSHISRIHKYALFPFFPAATALGIYFLVSSVHLWGLLGYYILSCMILYLFYKEDGEWSERNGNPFIILLLSLSFCSITAFLMGMYEFRRGPYDLSCIWAWLGMTWLAPLLLAKLFWAVFGIISVMKSRARLGKANAI